MLSARQILLRVLFFCDPSDPDTWVAQALEHDIAAHGSDVGRAKVAFERTVAGYFKLALKHHQEPLASLMPAPAVFWETWKDAAQQKVQAERMPSVDAYMLPVVTHEPLPTV